MLNPVPPPYAPDEPPLQPDVLTSFDWSGRLSLETIRAHTKTDDIPAVTDEQLQIYRRAALEAAELYTGQLLAGQRTITEPIQGPSRPRPGKMTYRFRLKYPVADGYVHLYGSRQPGGNRTFVVPVGARSVQVPIVTGFIDLSNCCDPCSSHHLNGGMMAAYNAGYKSPNDVPTGIVLGCLQYIAWVISHPGDELLSQRNAQKSEGGGIQSSNNIALISGALETWKAYDPEGF